MIYFGEAEYVGSLLQTPFTSEAEYVGSLVQTPSLVKPSM